MPSDDRKPVRPEGELLRLLVDKISAMLAYWDSALRCRFANRAYEQWFGVSPEALIGRHISELLGPLYPLNLPYIERALRGEPQEFEREIPSPTGGPSRHSLANYIPDVVDGTVRGFFVLVSDITRVKLAEFALAESEARLSGIIESSADAIISIDEEQRITIFNNSAHEIFGWTPKEVLGQPLEILLPERFREHHREQVRAFASSSANIDRHVEGRPALYGLRKSGEEFPAEGAISKLGLGNKTLLTVSLRDITEDHRIEQERQELLLREQRARKQAEAANQQLRESEERFRLTIDEAPIGMALVALDGRFIRVNRILCEIVGYTADELTGLSFQALTHPEDLDADLDLAGQLARGEIPRYRLEERYIRKDGTIVEIMLSASLLRGPGGAPLHYISQIEDNTERKRIEREQRFLAEVGLILATTLEYEETLTKIAELAVRSLADLCIVDLIEDDNEVRRLKVACRDPAKAGVCELLTKMRIDRRRPYLLASAMESQRTVLLQHPSAEIIASLAQSEEHHQALQAAEIHSMVVVPLVTHGRSLGAIAFVSSSDSRIYGPADVRLAEELAQRAALSIENARLYRAARRATQVRDDVLGIVAHDLRNPLNTILLSAQRLRRSQPEAARQFSSPTEMVVRAATRMNRLIQDLLDVTRLEAGRLPVEQEYISGQQVVSDSVEAERQIADSADIELRLDVAADLPEVWADRDRLVQVFENLIGNAIKFTKPGGRVTVGAARREGEVLFWVTDTGSGIAEDDLPHLFDRFWQSRTGHRLGTGLGLSIVKGVIEAHRGRIWVESALGQGSTFFFTIPTVRRVEASQPVSAR